ncbi:MAG: paraquat-inducible protein A [Pseudomonadota bacterium]
MNRHSDLNQATQLSTNHIACVECDLIVEIPPLGFRQRCLCPRCGHLLTRGNAHAARLALPYALCAMVMLPLSLLYPFISFARAGIENEMNLLQTAWTLYLDGSVVLSGLVLTFIITLPALLILAIGLVALSLQWPRRLPLVRQAARFVYTVNSWSMVEVFIIGVLVSLVKIANMATVGLGVSLWTYLAFAVFTVAALSKLDKYVVWHHLQLQGERT